MSQLTSQAGTRVDQRGPFHWSLIVAVNDQRVFESNLLTSPDLDGGCQIVPKHGFPSASKAYNAGIFEAVHDVLVFAHQDVYLPHGWLNSLRVALARLVAVDPHWGVVGVYGIARAGGAAGYVYSTGIGAFLGKPFVELLEAESLDEMLLVTRRSAQLLFDENLPGFHLYGADICLEAKKRSMRSYVLPAFCIHNSNGIRFLPTPFWRSYLYIRRKWWDELPVRSCCTVITKSPFPVFKYFLTRGRDFLISSVSVGRRCSDPGLLYQHLVMANGTAEQGGQKPSSLHGHP